MTSTSKSATMTRERQYQDHVALADSKPRIRLSLRANAQWDGDPRMLGIALARYKFVAKMLVGKARALEVGCGDAFHSRLVAQEVGALTAVDFDPVFIADFVHDPKWPIDCRVHDMLSGPVVVPGGFDAAYALDVLEHVDKADETLFLHNIVSSLSAHGVLIIGMPSLESQAYASPASKIGHINCKPHEEIRELLERYFHNIFLFAMNDEVVHTGYLPMAHYIMALCADIRCDGRV
jgi:2-polyprenyl-3-methyl-5-hydroxy-6-metoxy-1,4-benzoquinol methylase